MNTETKKLKISPKVKQNPHIYKNYLRKYCNSAYFSMYWSYFGAFLSKTHFQDLDFFPISAKAAVCTPN